MLRTGKMPPKEQPRPSEADVKRVIDWIDREILKVDCSGPRDPGRVTIRRLNRHEYNNTIRDLVGVEFKPADDFPVDDSGYGFDNIGDVLSVSPLLLEKYLNAAEKITAAAIVTEGLPTGKLARYEAERLTSSSGSPMGGAFQLFHGRRGRDAAQIRARREVRAASAGVGRAGGRRSREDGASAG
jgi:hypothetical protein